MEINGIVSSHEVRTRGLWTMLGVASGWPGPNLSYICNNK